MEDLFVPREMQVGGRRRDTRRSWCVNSDGDTLVVASGVALAIVREGGPGDDTHIGTNGRDTLLGHGGNDTLVGLAGADEFWGGSGTDVMYGGPDEDGLGGMEGDDVLYGGDGDDWVLLGGGSRMSSMAGMATTLLTGPYGKRDWLFCGKGRDKFAADRVDYVSRNCEVKGTLLFPVL